MTPIKTIVATAVMVVGGTVAAFNGLHIGQSPAAAANRQPVTQQTEAKATHRVLMSAKDVAKLAALMNGQQNKVTTQAHYKQKIRHLRHAVRHRAAASATAAAAGSISGSRSSRHSDAGHDANDHSYGGSNRGDGHSGDHGDGGGCD